MRSLRFSTRLVPLLSLAALAFPSSTLAAVCTTAESNQITNLLKTTGFVTQRKAFADAANANPNVNLCDYKTCVAYMGTVVDKLPACTEDGTSLKDTFAKAVQVCGGSTGGTNGGGSQPVGTGGECTDADMEPFNALLSRSGYATKCKAYEAAQKANPDASFCVDPTCVAFLKPFVSQAPTCTVQGVPFGELLGKVLDSCGASTQTVAPNTAASATGQACTAADENKLASYLGTTYQTACESFSAAAKANPKTASPCSEPTCVEYLTSLIPKLPTCVMTSGYTMQESVAGLVADCPTTTTPTMKPVETTPAPESPLDADADPSGASDIETLSPVVSKTTAPKTLPPKSQASTVVSNAVAFVVAVVAAQVFIG